VDPGTLAGIALAFAAIFLANYLEGGSPGAMFLLPPMLLVFGGTIGVGMAGGLLKDTTNSLKAVKRAFTAKVTPADESVAVLVTLAEQARRNGLLALEEQARTVEDPFLKQGVELLVDGTEPQELRDILESKVYAKKAEDKSAAKLFADMGGYAPTIGIIGTVLSLVHVLENLDKPEQLGHMIGAAFLATLWGVLSANVMFLPLASKLKRVSELECRQMEMLIEGLMAIQAGSNPRIIEQKLLALLPSGGQSPPDAEKQAA
jgi:chemotaxis protein MotA